MASTIEELICELEEDENSISQLLDIINLCECKINYIRILMENSWKLSQKEDC